MEKYKKLWKTINSISIIIIFISTAALIVSLILDSKKFSEFFGALLTTAIEYLILSFIILHSKEKLKKNYIKYNDERNIQIEKNASQSTFYTVSLLISLTALVFNFIDEKICITLIAFLLFVYAVYFTFVLYYRKKI